MFSLYNIVHFKIIVYTIFTQHFIESSSFALETTGPVHVMKSFNTDILCKPCIRSLFFAFFEKKHACLFSKAIIDDLFVFWNVIFSNLSTSHWVT